MIHVGFGYKHRPQSFEMVRPFNALFHSWSLWVRRSKPELFFHLVAERTSKIKPYKQVGT